MSNYPPTTAAPRTTWTSASADELLPGSTGSSDTLPPHPAHFLWLAWGPSPTRQDMAYSLEDEVYLALYAGWKNAGDDGKYPTGRALDGRDGPARVVGHPARRRKPRRAPGEVRHRRQHGQAGQDRAEYDPDNRFYPWMGRL